MTVEAGAGTGNRFVDPSIVDTTADRWLLGQDVGHHHGDVVGGAGVEGQPDQLVARTV